jgi:hypothetical protein
MEVVTVLSFAWIDRGILLKASVRMAGLWVEGVMQGVPDMNYEHKHFHVPNNATSEILVIASSFQPVTFL